MGKGLTEKAEIEEAKKKKEETARAVGMLDSRALQESFLLHGRVPVRCLRPGKKFGV